MPDRPAHPVATPRRVLLAAGALVLAGTWAAPALAGTALDPLLDTRGSSVTIADRTITSDQLAQLSQRPCALQDRLKVDNAAPDNAAPDDVVAHDERPGYPPASTPCSPRSARQGPGTVVRADDNHLDVANDNDVTVTTDVLPERGSPAACRKAARAARDISATAVGRTPAWRSTCPAPNSPTAQEVLAGQQPDGSAGADQQTADRGAVVQARDNQVRLLSSNND